MKGTSCLLSVLLVFSLIIVAFSPIAAHAETFSNVSEFPNFDMDCYVADLFTTDGHTLNTSIELELNSESRNRIMKNSIESNSILMGSMTAWQVATFEASDVTSDSVTEIGYYESIILSSINTAMKSSHVKDFFDNAVIKDGKMLFSSFKDILKSEYFITDFSLETYKTLSAEDQSAYIKSFGKAFEKQYPKLDKTSDALKTFSTVVKTAKSFEECMNNYAAYSLCSLTNKHLTKVINDLYEQCPAEKVTLKAALLNISSACTSAELDLGADALDAVYRGADIIFGVLTDGWVTKIISAHPAGLALMLGRAVGKSVSNILFSTDAICENYYKMCCFDEFEQLVRSVTRYEMNTYTENKTNDNANNMFWAIRLMYNINEVGCDLSIDYAKTIYEKSVAGIFLDKTEYENYKKTVEFIRNCKRTDYSTLMTSYIFYLEEDYPEIYAAYMKLMDEIENPVVHATGISFSKKHMTLGLADDMFFFWNNAEVSPSNASNRAVNYTSSDENVVSIKPGNTLIIELHQTGTVTITATSEDGGFTDQLTINVVEGHGNDGIHIEDPATSIYSNGKCGDNVYWRLYSSGLLKIYGTGSMNDFEGSTSLQSWYNDKSKIQTVFISEGVTSVGAKAFAQCENLKSIIIPDTIKSIGKSAFSSCTSLTTIFIPDCVTTIDNWAFEKCTNLTEINIPDSVVNIGHSVFSDCSNLNRVTLPTNMTTIGSCMFFNCKSLTNFTIPISTKKIDSYAFCGCSNLTNITIPDSVTYIGDSAFNGCNKLQSIRIPDSVTDIGFDAFACSGLKNVIIGNNVKSLNGFAFKNNKNLREVVIGNGVTTISDYQFQGCESLESISIGTGIQNIGYYAFDNCKKLSKVNISSLDAWCKAKIIDNPINIAQNLYINNKLVEDLIIPDTVNKINDGTFSNCKSISSVIIGNNVTEIGSRAFSFCSNLKEVSFGNSVSNIRKEAFFGCSSLIKVNISDISSWCKINFNVTYDQNTIYNNPLSYAKNLYLKNNPVKELIIPSDVSKIYPYAFYNCESITSINIGNGLSEIGDRAFYGCKNVQHVTIGDGVESIKDYAFCDCSSLVDITIPESLTNIGKCAFYGRDRLCDVYYRGTESQWYDISMGINNERIANANIHFGTSGEILAKSLSIDKTNLTMGIGKSEYLIANIWPNNTTDKTIIWTSSDTKIATVYNGKVTAVDTGTVTITATSTNGKFATCTVTVVAVSEDDFRYTLSRNPGEDITASIYEYNGTATNLRIPDKLEGYKVVSIWGGFENCTSLVSVEIPDGVEYIGDEAFKGCTNLKSIKIPESVKKIDWGAFYNCESLTSITIPASVTEIYGWTFCNCQSLQSVKINGNITDIDSHAFCDCYNLSEFDIPSTVTEIGEQAFWGCSRLRSITIPVDVTEINYATFKNCTGLKDVFFNGNERQWNAITIGEDNECLLNATIHYGSIEQIEVTDVSLNKTKISLIIGNNEVLVASILPIDATDKSLTWTSSNSGVVTVNNGKVTGIKIGTATITAKTANGKIATCIVTVNPSSNEEEKVGDLNHDGIVNGADSGIISRYVANWSGYDKKIINMDAADLNRDGNVNGADAGILCRYTAGWQGYDKYIISLNKTKIPNDITLSISSLELTVNEKRTLSATISPSDAANKTITWVSGDNSIATVSNGTVTAISPGTVTITATTYNGKLAKCTVIVKPIEVSSISFNNGNIYLSPNGSYQITATIMPDNAFDKSVTWSSSNTTVATVDSKGYVVGKAPGTSTIIAKTTNNKSTYCLVTVLPITVDRVSLNTNSVAMDEGETCQLIATVSPNNATDKSLSWSTDDNSVATVSNNGIVTAISGGTAEITVKTSNGKTAKCQVNVHQKIMPTSIEVLPVRLTLVKGNYYDLNSKVLPANAEDKTIMWTSNNSSAVSVDNDGRVTAKKSGQSAIITAKTTNGLTSNVEVDVVNKAEKYGKYWELGVEYGGTIYKAPVTVGTPSYIRDSGDSLYFVSSFDSELYQGAKLKILITSGSSGSYDSYTVTLSSNTYDYKANKGYISLCQYLSNYKNKYIRVYTEIILANGQVIKPANLGTDDAIYLYIN